MSTSEEAASADQIISEADGLKEESFLNLSATIAESKTALAKLINNAAADVVLKAKHREYKVKLDNRYYVREIIIELSGNPSGSFELTWTSWTKNGVASKKAAAANNQIVVSVSDLITDFTLLPPEKMLGFSSVAIKSVKVVGINQHEFHSKLLRLGIIERLRKDALTEIDKLKAQIASQDAEVKSRQDKADEISANINELDASIEKIEQEAKEATEKLEATVLAIKNAEGQLNSINQTAIAVEKEITDKKALNGRLASQVEKNLQTLSELKSQINLFPTEIKGFADEGAGAISKYLILSFLPIVLIFFLGYDLYESGKAMISHIPQGTIEKIYLMAARVPYVVVTFAIAGASFKVAQIFINEIISIYRQRLNLTKLSILAKDVSDSSAASLGLSDDALYEKRVYLKMLILREHLKSYLPTSFSYRERAKPDENESEEEEEGSEES